MHSTFFVGRQTAWLINGFSPISRRCQLKKTAALTIARRRLSLSAPNASRALPFNKFFKTSSAPHHDRTPKPLDTNHTTATVLPFTNPHASLCSLSPPTSSSALLQTDEKQQAYRHEGTCPTGAILVDTDGSARVSLTHCTTTVHSTVQARLRALLVERMLAPLLTDSMEAFTSDADAESLALATLHVHQSLQHIHLVAFSTMAPRLQHGSWQPLWAAYRHHLLSLASKEGAASARGREKIYHSMNGDEHAEAVRVSQVNANVMDACVGDAKPLFGSSAARTLFCVEQPLFSQGSIEERQGAMAATTKSNLFPAPRSSVSSTSQGQATSHEARSGTQAGAASRTASLWECFRVDSYVPSHIQLHAAVRHVLQTRRPASLHAASAENAKEVSLCVRPVCVIALVAPDHLVDAHVSFLEGLEKERSEVLTGKNATNAGSSVQVLLFNSTSLVRVFCAV